MGPAWYHQIIAWHIYKVFKFSIYFTVGWIKDFSSENFENQHLKKSYESLRHKAIWSSEVWRTYKPVKTVHFMAKSSINYRNGILFLKLFWPIVRKNCSRDWEKLLKFEVEGRELAKLLRSLEQFIEQRMVMTIFETECFLNFFLEVSQI